MAAACTGAGWPERQELARTWMMSDPCSAVGLAKVAMASMVIMDKLLW